MDRSRLRQSRAVRNDAPSRHLPLPNDDYLIRRQGQTVSTSAPLESGDTADTTAIKACAAKAFIQAGPPGRLLRTPSLSDLRAVYDSATSPISFSIAVWRCEIELPSSTVELCCLFISEYENRCPR